VRMIVWRKPFINAEITKWDVLGEDVPRDRNEDTEVDVEGDDIGSSIIAKSSALETSASSKRPHSPTADDSAAGPSKRARISAASDTDPPLPENLVCSAPALNPRAQHVLFKSLDNTTTLDRELEDGDGEGDIFLSHGWQERFCRCAKCDSDLEPERYLLEEQELYEPPEDPDSTASLEELGMRALGNLPREKALDGIRAYNDMRDDLLSYLRPFAAEGRVVSEVDMKQFFEERKARLLSSSSK